MNLVLVDDDQDRGYPLVPEGAMKIDDVGGVDLPDLTEVDDRTAFLAENALDAKLLKGSAKGVGMRHLPRCAVELVHAGKEVWRLSVIKAKVFLPVFLGSGHHFRADLLPSKSVMDSARNWHSQPGSIAE